MTMDPWLGGGVLLLLAGVVGASLVSTATA
jgi:hypothetical protein